MAKQVLRYLMFGAVLAACGTSCCNFGCTSIPAAMPQEFATAAKQLSASMVDQAIWKELQGQLRGHALQPGYRTSAGVEYFAEVRIVGFDGDVGIAASGEGSGQMSPEVRAAIVDLAREDLSLRARALDFLETVGKSWLVKAETVATQPAENPGGAAAP